VGSYTGDLYGALYTIFIAEVRHILITEVFTEVSRRPQFKSQVERATAIFTAKLPSHAASPHFILSVTGQYSFSIPLKVGG